ncbi:hypothetical protein SH2C18_00100 [Clostridium sediminicola]|uniref:methyl-accepting chemotaxis protein n=1 Tax=Clostridium sediminicola TaxID=3114879 RepID=UPI0031F2009E
MKRLKGTKKTKKLLISNKKKNTKILKGFRNLKISTKLTTSFILVAILAGIVGAIGINQIFKLQNSNIELYENMTIPVSQSSKMLTLYQRIWVSAEEMILEDDSYQVNNKFSNMNKVLQELDTVGAEFQKSIHGDTPESKEMNQLFNEFLSTKTEFAEGLNELLVLCQQNKDTESLVLLKGRLGAKAFDLETAINNLAEKKLELAKETANETKKLAGKTMINMGIYVVIAVILAIVFGLYISNIISKPIKKLLEASEKLAEGDVDVNVESNSNDEIGQLTSSFKKMITNIKDHATVAEKIASGDLSVSVDLQSEKDLLGNSMNSVVETLKNLISETNMLTKAAVDGEFEVRGDLQKFNGEHKEIVKGINETLDTVVEKIYWYEGILDSIENPISVTDLDMNWTFLNKALLKHLDIKREDVLGKHCSNWDANVCNTEDCGIAKLKNNINKTKFNQNGNNYNISTSYLYNKDSEKIGHIELITDITEEYRKKLYQDAEVEKLAKNLDLLSEGNLNLNFDVAEADEYTTKDRENFLKINNYFKAAIKSISENINELSNILSSISNGNLDVETTVDYKGDFSQIKISLNDIIQSLNEVLSDINNAADQVASGSKQVSDSSLALSQGATEQASSVEELTATIEEISTQTKQNAQNANKAKEITEGAKSNATKGNLEMEKMLSAMGEINESSNNISKIIKVIDEIAFQTNILALNAAVEAARAGEHGKGFAVVAEEVRNLAARSANAAKETTALIEGSINKVKDGTKIANNTANSLHKIVKGAADAAELVGNIAIASNEQALGVNQVNQGISQIANVVQTTSATSEETASASEELSGQAEMLKNQVSKFKLKEQNEVIAYKDAESLNPEVLKILESMSKDKKKEIPEKILLNDLDFGKY